MAYSPAQYPAEDIAPAQVGRQDAVANHKGKAAGMVRDDLQGHVGFRRSIIGYAAYLAGIFDNGEDQIRLKIGRLALQHGSDTLQPCPGVDVLMFQRGIGAVLILVELGKHQVPQLQETAAVAVRSAFRPAAATFRSQVDMDFRAGTAGAAADFPEIIFQADDTLVRNSYHVAPDFIGFIIAGMDSDIQFIPGQFQFFRQEFPAPGNDFLFKVIAEGKIPQHFKVSMVAGRTAYVFNIAGAHTFLAGGHTGGWGFHFAGKERLEGSHAGADQ